MKIVAIILTFNEELHIQRCLERLQGIASDFLVIDCFSTDNTVQIAQSYGAKVLQRKWLNHADQFKWGMSQVDSDADWIMRVDADEYLSDVYIADIQNKLSTLPLEIAGVYCGLRRIFQGKMIRFGAVNISMLRLWRFGKGTMEIRWMDEHIKLAGPAVHFKGYIIDHNLNSLGYWIAKHNSYSAREVLEILNKEYRFLTTEVNKLDLKSPFGRKRWLKENVYAKLPGGIRAFAYFCYRYFFALGFLDGAAGLSFHFLQGFWYRFLVDAKLAEVKRVMRESNLSVSTAIQQVLDIDVKNN
ncbi:MAG: glycosyltransferase family 2 protein [Burkholderiales bacterium]|nr:glycosyltransferase family 2 protein [Burkholderiales bacterium]